MSWITLMRAKRAEYAGQDVPVDMVKCNNVVESHQAISVYLFVNFLSGYVGPDEAVGHVNSNILPAGRRPVFEG